METVGNDEKIKSDLQLLASLRYKVFVLVQYNISIFTLRRWRMLIK